MILSLIKSGYKKVHAAFQKTGSLLGDKIRGLLGSGSLDEDTLESLEEAFYEADLGVKTTMELVEQVRALASQNRDLSPDDILKEVREDLVNVLKRDGHTLSLTASPSVILVVGANGNGKTTSIAKLAMQLKKEGKKVLLVAGDTFRAAAVEQLEMWAQRIGVDIVKGQLNSDPAAVAFDGLSKAQSKGHDVVLIDTAGRLHTKTNLMKELEKIKRSCHKVVPNSPQETLLVLDTSIGQNAVDQARIFHEYTPLTGLVLSKLDGTAKGGIVVAIQRELGVPVKFIGVGEGVEDLQPFDPEAFVSALFA